MKNIIKSFAGILYPPVWVLVLIPILSFGALVLVFVFKDTENVFAYAVYGMSAYSLTIWVAALPKCVRQLRAALQKNRIVQKWKQSAFGARYLDDFAFRGSVSIYQGMIVDFIYALFRLIVSICYASVWFLSMAIYYLVLGGLRLFLIRSYRYRTVEKEISCYRRTAWLLFLLNLSMGGMILLMIVTDAGYSYPGYIIYLSALYTFYTMIRAVINLVKFRRLGSPILSASKILNFVAAMMSILGLQTAMLSRFSANGEDYRQRMNILTGSFGYGIVILIAVYMLRRSRKMRKEVNAVEQIRE